MKTLLKNNFFPLVLGLLIIIAFIFLQPTSVSSLDLNNKQSKWDTFVKQIDGKRVDTKLFWETREFYSPGHFVFKKEGLDSVKQKTLLNQLEIPDLELDNQLIFLEYKAPDFASYESLIPTANFAVVQKKINDRAQKQNVLAKGENFVIIKSAPNKAILIFIATLDEMKKANGFFDYPEDDKELVKDKSWLNISEIKNY